MTHAAPYAPHPADQAPVPVEQQAHHAAPPLAGGSAGPGTAPGGPGLNPPPPGGPWQRYDPWNAPAPAGEQRRGTKRGRRLLVAWTAVVALVAGGIGGLVGTYLERDGSSADVELPQAGAESVKRDPGSIAGIAARALPGVVTIHVSGSDAQDTGTGFVLDSQGHILTNNHVVEPAGSSGDISVTFSGGETAKAEVIGRDSGYDLAVVKVTGVRGLKPLALGNSENVQVGDPVVAIGAPFDLANTVTSGIISAKERPITAAWREGRRQRRQLRRRAPDRRAHQPGQLGRPAGRCAGPRHRDQQRHPVRRQRLGPGGRPGRLDRPRFRHPHQPGQARRRGADQHGPRDPPCDRRHARHGLRG